MSGTHADSTIGHYDDYYDGRSSWREISAADKARNVQLLWQHTESPIDKPRIIDIGCGEGALASQLAASDFYTRYVGVDVSSSGIAVCKSRGLRAATFEVFDGHTVALQSQSFDLAVLSHVLEHVESPRTLLYEAKRLATYVVVEVPLEHRVLRRHTDFVWTPVGHINFFDRRLIRFLVQSCGLEIVADRWSNPDRATLVAKSGRGRGTILWLLRDGALRMSRTVAAAMFTYHHALLARSASTITSAQAKEHPISAVSSLPREPT